MTAPISLVIGSFGYQLCEVYAILIYGWTLGGSLINLDQKMIGCHLSVLILLNTLMGM